MRKKYELRVINRQTELYARLLEIGYSKRKLLKRKTIKSRIVKTKI